MTARAVIILGFAVILAGILAAVALTHLRRDRLATFTETLDHLTRSRAAKIAAVLLWAWIGWHFLAR
jgi:hypothetical protein